MTSDLNPAGDTIGPDQEPQVACEAMFKAIRLLQQSGRGDNLDPNSICFSEKPWYASGFVYWTPVYRPDPQKVSEETKPAHEAQH